jgi:primosomal protein N' (replication factor Y)
MPVPPGAAGPEDAEAVLAVAVPSPLRTLFDYLPPARGPVPQPGMRVRVPFGRGHKVGLVLERLARPNVARHRLRRILAVLDGQPLLDPSLLELLRFAAHYFHHPPGEVLATMLPPWLRQGRALDGGQRSEWILASEAAAAVNEQPQRLGALQRRLLQALASGPLDARRAGGEAAALRRLAARGLVVQREAQAAVAPAPTSPAPPLNAGQLTVVRTVSAALGGYAAFLLDGVTGSGKTEIYLALIEAVVARGRQALVLIPEIGLTPQIVGRFRARLGVGVAALHSAMADGERLAAWHAASCGQAPVVVGTRSAVFTPLARPGLVVVDEEHDPSYKQQEGLRYSARDLAVLRARQANVPVLLGSASPSLESLYNVRQGRYTPLSLHRRAGAGRQPQVQVVDLRGRRLAGGMCEPVRDALAACLDAGEQAILFVNRRGYAPVLLCRSCGATVECARCDAHMVLHRQEERMCCHHCGRVQPVPADCGCGATGSLRPAGVGTQRVVEHLATGFPRARVARVDRDSTRRRGAMQSVLERVHAGELDVLVGTQMLAKGHDFPNVTLVAILDADGGLFSADFRASERMAQLLTQVSGRAGRGERAGRVLIQTHHPQHPLLRTLVTGGYRAFGSAALEERETSGLPPFSHLALLRAEAHSREQVHGFLAAARAAAAPVPAGVALLGPIPAPMERRAGRVRAQLMLECAARRALHRCLAEWLPKVEALPAARRVRWSLDVDPQETL